MLLFSKPEKRISASPGSSAAQAMVSHVPAARKQFGTSRPLKVLAQHHLPAKRGCWLGSAAQRHCGSKILFVV